MVGNDKKVWLNGREEIANVIGRSPRAIPKLVKDEDLPAFKFYGTWTATLADITTWSSDVAKRHRRKP